MSTHLEDLAAKLAQPQPTRPNVAAVIENGNGHVYQHNRRSRRASTAELEFRGLNLLVEYFTEGVYMAATDTDDACYPCAVVKAVEIVTHGRTESGEWVRVVVDATELLGEWREDIERQIEQSWEVL